MIDVIIPAYNCHDTIKRCLSSIASQTLANICNVIIVDDFSTTNYNEEVELFSKLNVFNKIETITYDTNRGPGYARSVGQQHGTGDYVTFIDADDTFATAFSLNKLYSICMKDRRVDAIFSTFVEEIIVNDETKWVRHANDRVWMFGKMYRRAFLESNDILMNDSRSNEDMGYNQLVLACTDNIVYLDEEIYIWHHKEKSITRSSESDYAFKGLQGYINNHTWAFNEREKRNINTQNKSIISMGSAICMMYFYYIEITYTRPNDQIKDYSDWVYDYFKNCIIKYMDLVLNVENIQPIFISIANENDINKRYMPRMTFEQFLSYMNERYMNENKTETNED